MEKTYTIQEVLKIMEPLEKEFWDTSREILGDIERWKQNQ